jgi:glutamine synthetase
MKLKLNYVWLDGNTPEPNLRSKIKIREFVTNGFWNDIRIYHPWSFDGSSTNQAEGSSSDCNLNPVRVYFPKIVTELSTIYILCEVLDKDNNPHPSNDRNKLGYEDKDFWVGFEQEYFIRSGRNKDILGFNNGGNREPQGVYYCGVGGQIVGRDISNEHLDKCIEYHIGIEGTNAEVALGQWEYQIFAEGKLKAADDLIMSRYFLFEIAEKHGYDIELHPKPLKGDWNGSGLHTNFSTGKMRDTGGEQYFKAIFNSFEVRVKEHIQNYGSNNELRLTGKHETQSINKFTWGISDRGASIRVPKSVGETWKGYLEDRRPAANANPYKVIQVITETLNVANQLERTLHSMFDTKTVDSTKASETMNGLFKNMLSGDELLKEYRDDENEINSDLIIN